MTTFDERGKALERRVVHGDELRFRACTHRNRLLATWTCKRMRLTGGTAAGYVVPFTESAVVAGDEASVACRQAVLRSAGVDETAPEPRNEMERCAPLQEPSSVSALRWIKARPSEARTLIPLQIPSTKERDAMTDKELRRDILDELDFDPSLDAGAIGVAVSEGVATLTGHVGSYAEKFEAERAVRRVKGVRAIAQEIQVRHPEDRKIEDDQIAARALAIIDWSVHLPRQTIQVKVAQGWITLTGSVPWQYQAMGAEAAVRKLSGVVGVSNVIEIRPEVRPAAVKEKILEAFKRSALFEADAIKVSVEGDRVTLDGAVTAWAEREAAERAAWSVPGVRSVDDRLVALS